MSVKILMPALSPTMTEGNLAKWLKKEGDTVKPGETIAEIETDKATMEVESIDEGVIGKIFVQEGTENVKVGQLIAILLEEGEKLADIKIDEIDTVAAGAKITDAKIEMPKEVANIAAVKSASGEKIFASPLARRIASDKNIDLTTIDGSGPHGRVVKRDLENITTSSKVALNSASNSFRNDELYTAVPNSNMRKVIAKRLLESKQTIPHFYLSIECNLDKLLQFREELNQATDVKAPKYKLSVNDFIIKAVAGALADVPEANSSWTDEAILLYNNVDISVAVAIDGGLITPIIKNADKKTLSEISNEMKDLAKRARDNALKPEEFQGGGFSISNLGMFGIKKFEAIVNPPQSAILACGATTKRAIVIGSDIRAANMCDFSLSCDHRVVDGAVGASFLQAFKKYIENPVLLLV
jgi:pyruvate dehydrogenase E2 component (dihydrolipoamide acetyltransferase)